MKKAMSCFPGFLFIIFIILAVCDSSAADKKNRTAIKTVDNYIAVFDFEVTTGDQGISRPLTDKVIYELSTSDRYEVIDRGNMNKILKEQKFQMTGCVAQECKVEAGQILGVGKIVSGSVGIVGKTYYLMLLLIDVKTGKVELSAEDECRCEIDELLGSTKRLARKLLGEQAVQPPAALKPSSVSESNAEQATKAKAESEVKVRAEAEARVRAEAEAKAKAEAKAEEAERIRLEQIARAKAKAEAEAKARTEAEARAKAEEAERLRLEQTARAKAKAEADAKARAEAEAKAKAEAAERIMLEQIARAKAKADAEAKARAEAESRANAEAEKVKAAQIAQAEVKKEDIKATTADRKSVV